MTRYDALIEKGWEHLGLARLLVSRTCTPGSTDYAVLRVDRYCLGVKDVAFEAKVPESALQDRIARWLPADRRERMHPACARKLIEGAVAYAESLGFAPPQDLHRVREALPGLDATLCPQDFTFGRNGRPCYVRQADDTKEHSRRVLALLEKRFGLDGFDLLAEAEPAADDFLRQRDDLWDFMESEPDTGPGFYELSGIITALLICPKGFSPLTLLGILWGPHGRTWRDEAELERFSGLLLAYWDHLNHRLQAAIGPGAPPDEQIVDVWKKESPDLDDSSTNVVAAQYGWVRGFLSVTKLWPEAWDGALTRPDLAPHWEVIGWWYELEIEENSARVMAAAEADPPRTLNNSVKALAKALRPPAGPPPA